MRRLCCRTGVWVFAACALLPLAGCNSAKPTGDVTGKVTLDGMPMPGGKVALIPDTPPGPGEPTEYGGIIRNGTYKIEHVPLGGYKITVITVEPRSTIKGGKAVEIYGPYVQIPAKYGDKGQSGFSITVQKGAQEKDLQLSGMTS